MFKYQFPGGDIHLVPTLRDWVSIPVGWVERSETHRPRFHSLFAWEGSLGRSSGS